MSINVIKISDGSNVVATFSPALFYFAYYSPGTGGAVTLIIKYSDGTSFVVPFSNQSSLSSALLQLYTDIQSYYNQ